MLRQDKYDADAYCHRSDAYRHLKQYDKALKDTDIAVRLDPSKGDNWEILGNAQFELALYQQAQTSYDRAVRLSPYDGTPHYRCSLLHAKMSKTDLASSEMAKAKALGYQK